MTIGQKKAARADANHPNSEISKKLDRIYNLHNREIDFRLSGSPYELFLQRLGDPHLNLPPVIHIAGTNGKGSTLSMLRSILNENGYKTHTLTSPHLIKFNERIMISDREISDDILSEALDILWDKVSDLPLTFFEFTTALGFYLYSLHKNEADFLLLEVGMGGRLDCTNIIKEKILAIITHIGFDHMQFLGNSIDKIAFEKAGIIKSGTPTVIARQDYEEAQKTLVDIAQKNAAQIYLSSAQSDYDFSKLSLCGPHQKENGTTAITAVSALMDQGYKFDRNKTQIGLEKAHWRARLQDITRESLHHFGQSHCNIKIYLDGGHNPSAAQAIKNFLIECEKIDAQPTANYLLFGMQASRDPQSFLSPLIPYFDKIGTLPITTGHHPQSAQTLANQIGKLLGLKAQAYEDYNCAVSSLLKDHNMQTPCRIVIAGSLYLAGEILSQIESV